MTSFQQEFEELVKTDADIAEGRRRIDNQLDLIEWLDSKGHDRTQAEALLVVLERTIMGWQRRRQFLLDDIAQNRGSVSDAEDGLQ